MSVKWFIIFVTVCFKIDALAQNVTVVNQNIEDIESSSTRVKLIFDNDSVTEVSLNNGIFHLDSNLCRNFVDIYITPIFGQPYHNQYLRDQLKFIDTIKINQTQWIRRQTPRLFLGTDVILDSLFIDVLWISEWLNERNDAVNGISFWVNNSSALENSDKKRVKKVIHEYCERIGHKEYSKNIDFRNTPYITGQDDHFNEGTLITEEFIEGQNTAFMMSVAEKYSLVVTIIIDWNKD